MANNELIIAELGKISPSQYKVNDDFELVRQNLIDKISDINTTIAEVQSLADQSQNARFYEILATLYKTAADVNEKLLDVQKKIADLNKQQGDKPASVTNNNNLIMTTEELRKLLIGDRTTNLN